MATCCIGGVCVPYSAILPVLLLGLKWLMDKIMKVLGIEWNKPSKSAALSSSASASSCCTTNATSSSSSSLSLPSNGDNSSEAMKTMNGAVQKMTSGEEWDQLVSAKEWVVVKFTASWCKPCHAIQPFYEQLAQQYKSKSNSNHVVAFVVVDVDELEDVAGLYQVAMMPSFVILHHQQVVEKMSGSSQAQLQTFMKQHLALE